MTATFVLDIETINIMDHLKTPNKEISWHKNWKRVCNIVKLYSNENYNTCMI
jgi:hypothetical protein